MSACTAWISRRRAASGALPPQKSRDEGEESRRCERGTYLPNQSRSRRVIRRDVAQFKRKSRDEGEESRWCLAAGTRSKCGASRSYRRPASWMRRRCGFWPTKAYASTPSPNCHGALPPKRLFDEAFDHAARTRHLRIFERWSFSHFVVNAVSTSFELQDGTALGSAHSATSFTIPGQRDSRVRRARGIGLCFAWSR